MRNRQRRRGTVLVWTAVVLLVLLAFVGLSCDTAYVVFAEQQLQTVADASALAGAEAMRTDSSLAVSWAMNTAAQNQVVGSPMLMSPTDIVLGHYGDTSSSSPGFIANGTPLNAMQVTARRTTGSAAGPLNLIFGPMFGVNTAEVSRTAVAAIPVIPASVIVLDPSAVGALTVNFTSGGDLNVTGGTIAVNSSSANAVILNGSAGHIEADDLVVVGGISANGLISLPDVVKTGAPSTADPLAALPEPSVGGTSQPFYQANGRYQPGYYQNGMLITGNATLAAGIYVVDGGVSINTNNATVTGNGVMIYVHSGSFSMTGQTTLLLSPPTDGTYAGVTIFAGRSNASGVTVAGTQQQILQGTVYVPDGALLIRGQGSYSGNALISKQLNVIGSVSFNVVTSSDASSSGMPSLVQ